MSNCSNSSLADDEMVFEARLNVTAVGVLPSMMRDSPVYRHMLSEGIQ